MTLIGLIALLIANLAAGQAVGGLPVGSSGPAETPTNTPTLTLTPTSTADCRLNPPPTSEALWVEPVVSPTTLLTQTLTIYLGRGRAVTVESEAGIVSLAGEFSAFAPARVTAPLLPRTTHHLTVSGRVEYISGCYYTLGTVFDRFGGPLVIVQIDEAPGPRRAFLPLALK